MRVGNFKKFQDRLDTAILAERAVQCVEDDIGLRVLEDLDDVSADIDAGDLEACALKCIRARFPGSKRHRSFRRPSPHQHRNVFRTHTHSPSWTPDCGPVLTTQVAGCFAALYMGWS